MFDGKAFGEEMVGIVRSYVERATAPLLERIAMLETAAAEHGRRLDDWDGEQATQPAVKDLVAEAIAAIQLPEAPAAVEPDMAAIGEMIEREVAARVAALPKPADGKGVTLDDVRPVIDEAIGEAVAAIPVPRDGADADPALVKQLVDDAVAAIALPEAPPAIEPDMAARRSRAR
jgi:hypothetical protein